MDNFYIKDESIKLQSDADNEAAIHFMTLKGISKTYNRFKEEFKVTNEEFS